MAARVATTATATVAVIIVVGYLVCLFVFPEFVHFDGELGDGCDAGNTLCTYKEWVKTCEGGAAKCSIEVYHRKGGKDG